ncbi:MAG: ATP-dependent helicase UvrD/PcrA [Acidimicrobiaceae bacterium]|jgi:DNA helicase-2/ATP-dependent DNA helicase PcrA
MDSAALLEGLNEAQRQAVTSEASPLVILAGAGSGKTRVLTRRIAYRCVTEVADPRHVVALTFTRKAAGELGNRLRTLGLRDHIVAGTFHAVAYAQLRRSWSDRRMQAPTLLDRKVPMLIRLLGRGSSVKAVDAAGEIEWAKARMIAPADYPREASAARRRPSLDLHVMADLYGRYEQEKHHQRQVDFDDLLRLCAHGIETDAEFASSQRWQFRHLFVDEFQDVNPLQFRLLEAWRGERPDLCVVGDPNQAIYAWNGSDPTLINKLAGRIPGTETITLQSNYRSSPQVVATANRVLECGAVSKLRLRATRSEGPVPELLVHATDTQEAQSIAKAIARGHGRDAPWSHHAVLVRTNAQAVQLAEALRAVHAPVRVRGQTAFLQLPEIREAVGAMRRSRSGLRDALVDLEVRVAPPVNVHDVGDDDDDDDELRLDVQPLLSDAELTRIRNLEELLRLANEYLTDDRSPSTAGFEAWLNATVGSDDAGSGGDAVDIATFHAAKGLEWPVVHLAGLEEGLVPIFHAQTNEAAAEERRLFYVAITRAERELWLHRAEERTFGTRVARRKPSVYLEEIEPVLDAMRRGAAPADAALHLPVVRETVRAAGKPRVGRSASTLEPGDQVLFEELRRWRSQQAKAASVPAFVIFDDKTLTEVAARRPTDRAGLLAVPGIGPVKLERYGDDLLAVVAGH